MFRRPVATSTCSNEAMQEGMRSVNELTESLFRINETLLPRHLMFSREKTNIDDFCSLSEEEVDGSRGCLRESAHTAC